MLVKCKRCGDKSEKEEMDFELVGKKNPTKRYFHKNCLIQHKKEKEEKKYAKTCYQCSERGNSMNMEADTIGTESRPLTAYIHKECYEKYLERKLFLEKERKEKDKLNNTLISIYGIKNKEIPETAWMMLEKLRGGNKVFGNQQTGKRYKEGYTYDLIEKTFVHCSDTIDYYLRNKNFDGFLSAFRYSLKIIIDKIYYVENRELEIARKKEISEKYMEKMEKEHQEEFVTSYKKKENKNDISRFLDD